MKITIATRIEGSRVVADPDPLITAAPALLGFVPERSIVLLCFDEHMQVVATMRHDLTFTRAGRTPAAIRGLFAQLGELAASYGVSRIVAVLVDDRYEPTDRRFLRLARDAAERLAPAGGLAAAFAIGELRAGAYWHTAWQTPLSTRSFGHEFAREGTLSDPQASAVALERVFETGRPVLRSRSEIAALLTPLDHCEDAECAAVQPLPVDGPPGPGDADRLAAVYRAVQDRLAGDTTLTCARTNELAQALVSVHVRDAALGLCMTDARDAAEGLWLELARRLSGTAQAAAATLLGYHCYMAGSGAFASAAFDVAHAADPSYGLANLLDSALINGMRPQELGGLADLSFDLARRLGVTLPPATRRAAG